MPWIISSCFESMGEENCALYRARAQSRVSGLVRFRMNYACLWHYRIELFRCSFGITVPYCKNSLNPPEIAVLSCNRLNEAG